jgi:hypothetical protein
MGKIFLTIFVFGVSAAAQPFGVGVKVGVPLNDALSAKPGGVLSYVENTNRWVAGPFVEVRLPGRFALELDALSRSYPHEHARNYCAPQLKACRNALQTLCLQLLAVIRSTRH